LGFIWMQPVSDPVPVSSPALGPAGTRARDQYGMETYWKLLVTPDLWVTPGVQFLFNPSRNFSTDFVAVPQIKFRLFF
jgi:carbohydrate-selective porin OprB